MSLEALSSQKASGLTDPVFLARGPLNPQELQLELPHHAQLESFQAPEILMILAVASDIPVYLYLTLLTSLHKSCLRHGRDLL